jgi:hypothetical protein
MLAGTLAGAIVLAEKVEERRRMLLLQTLLHVLSGDA